MTMKELAEHFYNEKSRIRFLKEALKDAKRKMRKIVNKSHKNQFKGLPPVSKVLIEGYLKKKYEYLRKETKKKDEKQ